MSMETIIVAFIGIGAACYLLRRGLKTITGGKPDCACPLGGCRDKQCPEKDE